MKRGINSNNRTNNPTKLILILFLVCVAWIPTSILLGNSAASGQDAAGKGIYSAITTLFLLIVGALGLGIPAVVQAGKHKDRTHVFARIAAWLILLSPVLVICGVLAMEFFD